MTLEGCRRMLEAEKDRQSITNGFEYRYGSMTNRIKELQNLGHFGDLTH